MTCPAARIRLPRGTRVEAAWGGFSSSAAICSDVAKSNVEISEEEG